MLDIKSEAVVQPVNVHALHKAAVILIGEQNTDVLFRLYKAFDEIMLDGYNVNDEAEGHAYDAGYNEGFSRGEDAGYVSGAEDGYLDGVRDARANPAEADGTVERIMANQAAQAAEEAYDDAFNAEPRFNAHSEGETFVYRHVDLTHPHDEELVNLQTADDLLN